MEELSARVSGWGTATGAYLLSGHDGPYAVERFSCSTDGSGDASRWSWTATREDPRTGAPLGRLELNRDGVALRLHVEAGSWVLRGAAAAGEVVWRRGSQERTAAGDGFAGSSPAHLVAACALAPGPVRLRLVEITEPVLATRAVLQDWTAGQAEVRDDVELVCHRWSDTATGSGGQVWLSAGLVVAAPAVRLLSLTLT